MAELIAVRYGESVKKILFKTNFFFTVFSMVFYQWIHITFAFGVRSKGWDI